MGNRRGGSNVYPQSVLSENVKNIDFFFFFNEIFNFYSRNFSVLHGQVFVMLQNLFKNGDEMNGPQSK